MADPCLAEPPAPDTRIPDPAPSADLGRRSAGPDPLPACPICRATSWSKRRFWTSLRDCAGCGTVLNDRAASRSDEEARYRIAGRPVEGEDGNRAASRWRFVVRQAGRTPHRVLDVGCGAGAFLEAARRDGAEVHGIEIDPAAADAARRSRGLSVTIGSILGGVPLGYGWDVVTLWDVLDHLDDPAEALARLRTRMAPGGLIVVRGRNAALHAPIKRISLRVRRILPNFPDPAVVHRFGLRPDGWRRLLTQAGFGHVDRHSAGGGWLLPSVLFTARLAEAQAPNPWEARAGTVRGVSTGSV